MLSKWFVIVNPGAGKKKQQKKWALIQEEFRLQNIPYDFQFINYKGHSETIVKEAVKKGYRKLICVGGDGSIHFVINAILNSGLDDISDIQLAIIPMGTGNDLAKTYGISKNIKENIATIKKGKTLPHDIGQINLNHQTIYFSNAAGIGFDGYVTNKIHQYKQFGASAYLIGAIIGIFKYKRIKMRIEFNNMVFENKILLLLMGIGKFIGGGMQLTDQVNPNDGLLDISIVKKLHFIDLIKNIRGIFKGNIFDNPLIECYKTKAIKIILNDKETQAYLQLDGETFKAKHFVITQISKQIQLITP